MLDMTIVRERPAYIQEICDRRGVSVDVYELLSLDHYRRKLGQEHDEIRAETNKLASEMSGLAAEQRADKIEMGRRLRKRASTVETILNGVQLEYDKLSSLLPNLLADDTPRGADDTANVEVAVYGSTSFQNGDGQDHIVIAKGMGMDMEAGARIAGTGFPLLRGQLARLELALMRFVMDEASRHGFEYVSVPLMAKSEIMSGLGFNPRRQDEGTELFPLENDGLFMVGTAEIPLVGQLAGQVIDLKDDTVVRLVAQTACFRREGASGRRDAGLYRNKMFHKVELVVVCHPNRSEEILEELLAFEVSIFKKLGLHFRVIRICDGDLGAPAYKKYDVEAWMKGRGTDGAWGWGELTSCSNCTDYQARRLKVKYRDDAGKLQFPHTLNGTGVTTRALIPILEQFQDADGNVKIPEALIPYLPAST